jgi:hypothetical protein
MKLDFENALKWDKLRRMHSQLYEYGSQVLLEDVP